MTYLGQRLFRAANLALAAAAITLTWATPALTQTEKVLYSFVPGSGENPVGSLILDSAGNLFGSTVQTAGGHGTVFELSPVSGGGWNQTVLSSFARSQGGWYPETGLVSDPAGNLYGTTLMGGNSPTCSNGQGCGVVFELSPVSGGGWKETVLHSFSGGADGGSPQGSLILDSLGNLYGTTRLDGNLADCGGFGCGVVFMLSPSSNGWKETLLHTFTGGTDGAQPLAALLLDPSGNLYGTTYAGGNLTACASTSGCGVAFELSPVSGGRWKETVLHTFTGAQDGANPFGNLIRDSVGNLYGTTYRAGDLSRCNLTGCGTVFQLSPQTHGWKITNLQSFAGGQNGSNPAAGLVMDSSGNLFGTTQLGGNTGVCSGGCGTVFELSLTAGTWHETLLHAFTASGKDGYQPLGGLILDSAGNLYGTTSTGGTNGAGVVFEVTP